MRVRLLNPNIYADPNYRKLHEKDTSPHDPGSYPIVVDGFFYEHDLVMKRRYGFEIKSIKVGGGELDRVFKDHYSDGKPMGTAYGSDCVLGWWNEPGKPKAWEPLEPFDYWKKLKASREVGETVGKGYL